MKRILLAVMVVWLVAIGCDSVVDDPPVFRVLISPGDCIDDLQYSFDACRIDYYKQCLSPHFTFYINPDDVGDEVRDGYIIPESWGYEDDCIATENLFAKAYNISLDLSSTQIGSPDVGATTYVAEDVQITLLVMIDAKTGLLAEGVCDFTFESYTSDGRKYWRIKDWVDKTTAGETNNPDAILDGTITKCSLGYIKAYYRDPKGGGG